MLFLSRHKVIPSYLLGRLGSCPLSHLPWSHKADWPHPLLHPCCSAFSSFLPKSIDVFLKLSLCLSMWGGFHVSFMDSEGISSWIKWELFVFPPSLFSISLPATSPVLHLWFEVKEIKQHLSFSSLSHLFSPWKTHLICNAPFSCNVWIVPL